ncbi:hypothetical protein BJ741DRAFT_646791 [Chytriomyces cf. hyalinus JEL632]|nr:hypothetical protein BJ741DRAFT_646791 [Chytriomyces cf. hyalinus JEL632]
MLKRMLWEQMCQQSKKTALMLARILLLGLAMLGAGSAACPGVGVWGCWWSCWVLQASHLLAPPLRHRHQDTLVRAVPISVVESKSNCCTHKSKGHCTPTHKGKHGFITEAGAMLTTRLLVMTWCRRRWAGKGQAKSPFRITSPSMRIKLDVDTGYLIPESKLTCPAQSSASKTAFDLRSSSLVKGGEGGPTASELGHELVGANRRRFRIHSAIRINSPNSGLSHSGTNLKRKLRGVDLR